MTFTEASAKCPPTDAMPTTGTYFRVGRNKPPTEDDFKSQAELGRALGGDECLRKGLSTLRALSLKVDLGVDGFFA